MTQTVKSLPTVQETQALFWSWEDPLEKGMATHSSILAWKIPWTEEPGSYIFIYTYIYYFANKVPSSQGYGFSSGHVWM